MSLTELMDKNSSSIYFSQAVRAPGGGEGYQHFSKAFGGDLVRLPSFTYTKEDMRGTGLHLRLDGIKPESYGAVWPVVANVVSYAIMRAALDSLPVAARRKIWSLMELAHLRDFEEGGEQKFNDAMQDYVRRVGRDKVEKYLTQALGGLERLRFEVNDLQSEEELRLKQNRLDYNASLILHGAAAYLPSEEPLQPSLNSLIHGTTLRYEVSLIEAILKFVKNV